jgi:hypothetical protein
MPTTSNVDTMATTHDRHRPRRLEAEAEFEETHAGDASLAKLQKPGKRAE